MEEQRRLAREGILRTQGTLDGSEPGSLLKVQGQGCLFRLHGCRGTRRLCGGNTSDAGKMDSVMGRTGSKPNNRMKWYLKAGCQEEE